MPRPVIPVCLVLLSLAPGWLEAAPRSKPEVQVTPVKRASHAPRAAPRAASALSAAAFRRQVHRKTVRLTGRAIAVLKRLINVTPDDDPDKADLLFRLAEHYRELKTDAMFRARELDETIFKARTADRARLRRRQQGWERSEKKWLLDAMRTYLRVVQGDAYQGYARMDQVLFNVADMLGAAGRQDRALGYFRRLIRNYPKSAYIPDAYISFAEHYFNAGQVEQALKLYEQVSRFPGSPVHDYALYKQGWCWLNLKDPRRALEKFVQVIRGGGSRAGRITLVREAKKDAVRAYSHVGEPARAWDFFRRVGGDDADRMMQRLATLLYDQGKFLESIQVHRKLIALRPKSERLCDWQQAIVSATLSGKDKRQQLVEVRRLANVSDTLERRNLKTRSLPRCRQRTSNVLRELATTWHRECQVTRNLDTCRLARQLYDGYLARFSGEAAAYQIAFYHAELLFKLEDWPAAARAYNRVVKMRPKGANMREAAYACVISWQNALEVEDHPSPPTTASQQAPRESLKQPLPIPEGRRRMLRAFATYLKHVPDSPDRVKMLYQEARTYYTYNHHEKAVPLFARVVNKHPEHELAEYSAMLLLDALNILGQEQEMERWVDRILANPKLARMRPRAGKLKVELGWKRAERLRAAGQHRRCGELYVTLANAYQDDPRWPKMLFNAALCYEAAKLVGQAIAIRDTLIQTKPDSPEAKRALYMIAQNYQALAWYGRAAQYFERFARGFPGEPEAADALQNAIVFHMGRGAYDSALDAARLFTRTYGPRPRYRAQAAAVHFALAQIPTARGETDSTIRHYEEYLRHWAKAGGIDREVQAHVKIGELMWRQACPIDDTDGVCVRVKRRRSSRQLGTRRRRRGRQEEVPLRTTCGPDTRARMTLMRRHPARSKAALAHFERALALASRTGPRPKLAATTAEQARRLDDLRDAVAQAQFQLAEARLEQFLAVAFPKDLDFSSTDRRRVERSRRLLRDYMQRKDQLLTQARSIYRQVIKRRSPHWAIAAAARVGQLFQSFADALYTAPIPRRRVPKQLVTAASRHEFLVTFQEAYCTELERYAIKLEDRAVEALGTCLTKATDLSWYNEWSGLCERELDQLRPGGCPMAAEIRVQPGFVSRRTARKKLIRTLQ